jgi:hypothetical protein
MANYTLPQIRDRNKYQGVGLRGIAGFYALVETPASAAGSSFSILNYYVGYLKSCKSRFAALNVF